MVWSGMSTTPDFATLKSGASTGFYVGVDNGGVGSCVYVRQRRFGIVV